MSRIFGLIGAAIVAVALAGALTACNGTGKADVARAPARGNPLFCANGTTDCAPMTDVRQADENADVIYDAVFGEFCRLYTEAKAQSDIDKRWVGMAIAEAKLLESGAFLPTCGQGGAYALGKVAYGTVSPTPWGTDNLRYHNALVATTAITRADRDALQSLYKQRKGSGTYATAAKAYLQSKGYTLSDTYSLSYGTDPNTWDITDTYRASDSAAIVNTYDGLIEYDNEGVMRPALATSWRVSEDGLTYTFDIRRGVYWVDMDGREYAEVTAQNWVESLRRNIDNGDEGTGYLVAGIIAGAADYGNGLTDDFGAVGVKAIDRYTLSYTLEAPCPYFLTMLNYNPFAPICDEYACANANYGIDADNLLSCGPYIVTNHTKNNKIVFSANPKYWNKDNVAIRQINWISYADNNDVTAAYTDFKMGIIDGCSINTATEQMVKNDGLWDYAYIGGTDATAYGFYCNVARNCYQTAGFSDATSPKNTAQQAITAAAMKNRKFRLAIARGLDRTTYNAILVGKECAAGNLQNAFTPGTYVQLSKDVTTAINGYDVTFSAGTYYGAVVQAQLDADMGAEAMRVWAEEADGGLGNSCGFDGWYAPTLASRYLDEAIDELADQGIEISAASPITLDYPINGANAIHQARANALKQTFEATFEGRIRLNIISTSNKGWHAVGYLANRGADCNYDIYDCSGWGPDYGDPSTYLNTMLPIDGGMIRMCGLY